MSARDSGCAHCGAFCGESKWCSQECYDADAWGTEAERSAAFREYWDELDRSALAVFEP